LVSKRVLSAASPVQGKPHINGLNILEGQGLVLNCTKSSNLLLIGSIYNQSGAHQALYIMDLQGFFICGESKSAAFPAFYHIS
jgi:hypothetical protein